jgi:hypothetical protein
MRIYEITEGIGSTVGSVAGSIGRGIGRTAGAAVNTVKSAGRGVGHMAKGIGKYAGAAIDAHTDSPPASDAGMIAAKTFMGRLMPQTGDRVYITMNGMKREWQVSATDEEKQAVELTPVIRAGDVSRFKPITVPLSKYNSFTKIEKPKK